LQKKGGGRQTTYAKKPGGQFQANKTPNGLTVKKMDWGKKKKNTRGETYNTGFRDRMPASREMVDTTLEGAKGGVDVGGGGHVWGGCGGFCGGLAVGGGDLF